MRTFCLIALCLTALLASIPAGAQVRLTGRVVDENSGLPVPGARVEIFDMDWRSRRVAVTDTSGQFAALVGMRPGYRVRASRIGYAANATPVIWADDHENIEIEIRLDRATILLAPIEVVARSRRRPSPVLQAFRDRLRRGTGFFITREDIERRAPPAVTDLLATVPGVRLESPSLHGMRRTVYLTRAISGPRDCPAQIFLDGFLINRGNPGMSPDDVFTIDEAVSPSAIEGIEVYRGLSGLPAEFLGPMAHCGVVAIWTRRGAA